MRTRIARLVIRNVQRCRVLSYRLLSTARSHGRPRLRQPTLLLGRGKIKFGEHVVVGYFPSPHFLIGYCHIEARGATSVITVGDGSRLNNNFTAIAESTSINIGKRCLIGTNVSIYDSDFHDVDPADRLGPPMDDDRAVTIGDDVFIGSNVTILKGVSIGSGSVVGAGSVVTKSIPSSVLAAGNPAQVARKLGQ